VPIIYVYTVLLTKSNDSFLSTIFEPLYWLVAYVRHVCCLHNYMKFKKVRIQPINHVVLHCFLSSVREEFRYVLKGLRHERLDVQEQALKALCKLLSMHRVMLKF